MSRESINVTGSPGEPVVSLRGLSKSFTEGDSQRLVLDHLDCDFHQGTFTVLLGKSGSGKTRLKSIDGEAFVLDESKTIN